MQLMTMCNIINLSLQIITHIDIAQAELGGIGHAPSILRDQDTLIEQSFTLIKQSRVT